MFHRNEHPELGLTPRTRELLASPPVPFEFDKVEAACKKTYSDGMPYYQKYYYAVTKKKNAVKRAASVAKKNSKRTFKSDAW